MTREDKINILKFRISLIKNRKDIDKRGGALRKLRRQLRNLENEI